MGTPISQPRDVACHRGSHSVTCHPTQVNTPRLERQLNPNQTWLMMMCDVLFPMLVGDGYTPWRTKHASLHGPTADRADRFADRAFAAAGLGL